MSILANHIAIVHFRNNSEITDKKKSDTDEEKWYLYGAFRDNNSVPNKIFNAPNRSASSVPLDLPESKDVYFRKRKVCIQCSENESGKSVRSVHVVEIEHDGEWHFEAMFPNAEFKYEYLKDLPYEKRQSYIAELPFNKEYIISAINKERSQQIERDEDKTYQIQQDRKAIAEIGKSVTFLSRNVLYFEILTIVCAICWLIM